ncbi:hypothetical protein ACTG9Q_05300 [Actinokineospora sp. 24-640]
MIVTCLILGGAALLTLVVWRVRAATVTVDTILAESDAAEGPESPEAPIEPPTGPPTERPTGPPTITWPHPPNRLWSARR